MSDNNNIGFTVNKIEFREKVLSWLMQFDTFCFLDSHNYQLPVHEQEILIGAGVKESVKAFPGEALEKLRSLEKQGEWWFGLMAYDLKNEIHSMTSAHADYSGFPDLFFFQPQHVIRFKGGKVFFENGGGDAMLNAIMNCKIPAQTGFQFDIRIRETKDEYCSTIQKLREHIRRGDCYEINYCTEFYSEGAETDPLNLFTSLSSISPNPFSSFFRCGSSWLICASPERFIRKENSKIISQPIKGTSKRFEDKQKDEDSREQLLNSEKDRSENVMVVDLVRNDLSMVCREGSVKVDELFGVYAFPQVYQMISTISGELMPGTNFADIIRATFPMGSMTGAPKKRVMQLIDQYEKFRRGVFSGSVGYIDPEGDFDFNVVIRSIIYNDSNKYLSFPVGSGITYYSDPEKEWEECLMKAGAIRKVLDKDLK